MINGLINSKEWIELRAKLQFVEEKILRIMDISGWVSHKDLEEQVKDLLLDRHVILNKMFRMHVTEQEVARFREINDRLLELTRRMFAEHGNILDSLSSNPIAAILNGEDIEVESKLDVDYGADVLHLDDDDGYGSNFAQMIDAIAWTEDLEIRSCTSHPEETIEPDYLDDGTSWAEGCLVLSQFEDIIVCYAIHDLCVHKNYSIPDLLRIPSYTISHTIDSKKSIKL